MEFDWAIILWILIAVFIVITYLFKRFLGAQTYFIASMIRTRKPLPWFNKFSKYPKLINFLAEAGLILGFGVIAIDYLYGKKLGGIKRILLFVFSLSVIYFLFNLFFGEAFLKSFILIYLPSLPINPVSLAFSLFGLAGFTMLLLIFTAIDILIKTIAGIETCSGIAPIIPGVKIPTVPITVPLHVWISFFIIMIIHEGFHGITAVKEKIKLKSTGLLLLGFLPVGAFVEPDEQQLKKLDKRKALRIFAAGPMGNIISLLFFILLLNLFVLFVFMPSIVPWIQEFKEPHVEGMYIVGVDQNINLCGTIYASPAYGKLEGGWKVIEVNGKKINVREDLIGNTTSENKSIDLLVLTETNELKNVTLGINEEINAYGFALGEKVAEPYNTEEEITLILYDQFLDPTSRNNFLWWLALLSFLIAIVNFLPIEPFDGGRIAKIIFASYLPGKEPIEEKEKFVSKIFLLLILPIMFVLVLPLLLWLGSQFI
ncbi:site-2 protease family protein [Candidatus Micrarchaeota archaeon]|nr:site-2 protease family protein [Candidatus Micrarchaeota archaeon]